MLANARRELKSFAIELERSKVDPETSLFYERGHKIQFPDMDVEDFTRELSARFQTESEETDATDAARTSVMLGAPVVFICHAREDAQYAANLAADLKRNGVDVWLDKENLRGGDRWDAMIRRTIEDEVQYVVVIQSASLAAKDVGYVNREIGLALDRQKEYREPRTFIIPVSIDGPDAHLEELKDLQSIDLLGGDGVDVLVQAIMRDINLAGRQS